MTRAPRSASWREQYGAAIAWHIEITVTPSSGRRDETGLRCVPQLLLGGVLEARQQDRTLLKDFLSGLAAILEKGKTGVEKTGRTTAISHNNELESTQRKRGRGGNSRATSPRTIWG